MKILRFILALGVLVVSGCSSSSDTSEWQKDPITFSAKSETVAPVAQDGQLKDGEYWAEVYQVFNSESIVFLVQQARFGETCEAWAAEYGLPEGCTNDYAVDTSQQLMLGAPQLQWVTVATPSDSTINYKIKVSTLVKMLEGKEVTTPSGYNWAKFPFILTVKDSVVMKAQQKWVP